MMKIFKKAQEQKALESMNEKSLRELVELQLTAKGLPQLPAVEKAKFELELAIDQLYYSSKLEGSVLTNEMIDNAINGKEALAA
ncbi:MAG TPA: hypothetical protein VMA75_03965 [Candidatus Paceibacterota bacterium]|nr:hypothetical protein [Candidatus Paceibacterota bacterium]